MRQVPLITNRWRHRHIQDSAVLGTERQSPLLVDPPSPFIFMGKFLTSETKHQRNMGPEKAFCGIQHQKAAEDSSLPGPTHRGLSRTHLQHPLLWRPPAPLPRYSLPGLLPVRVGDVDHGCFTFCVHCRDNGPPELALPTNSSLFVGEQGTAEPRMFVGEQGTTKPRIYSEDK